MREGPWLGARRDLPCHPIQPFFLQWGQRTGMAYAKSHSKELAGLMYSLLKTHVIALRVELRTVPWQRETASSLGSFLSSTLIYWIYSTFMISFTLHGLQKGLVSNYSHPRSWAFKIQTGRYINSQSCDRQFPCEGRTPVGGWRPELGSRGQAQIRTTILRKVVQQTCINSAIQQDHASTRNPRWISYMLCPQEDFC